MHGPHRYRLVVIASAFGVAALATMVLTPARGQEENSNTAVTVKPAPVATPADAFGRGTPRGTVNGFLEAARASDWARAAEYLDLRGQHQRGHAAELARQLSIILDRTLWIKPEEVSDVPEGFDEDGLPPEHDLIGFIETDDTRTRVLLERQRGADAVPVWKVASETVAKVPRLYERFGYGRLGDYLPDIFFEWRLLNVALWQWIGLAGLGLLGAAGAWIIVAVLTRLARALFVHRVTWGGRAIEKSGGPLRLLIGVACFAASIHALALAVSVLAFFTAFSKGLTLIAITWLLIRMAHVFGELLERRMMFRGLTIASSVVPLARRTAQVFIAGLAFLAILDTFGVDVAAILAGLGLGGLAVALAAQKTVENLFGGVTLIFDQPVRVGDFCRFGDRVGTVEAVGLRSTRIRMLERTLVTVPNAEFSGMQIENFAARDRIWLHPTIGLRYETSADQLRWVLIETKRMLLAHPKIDPKPARVRFVNFGDYSLDLEIFAYVLTADIDEFLAVQEDVFLRLIDIVNGSGTGFAFPSQTIYAAADSGSNEEKTRAAEAQVKEWRLQNQLYLPGFPTDHAAALRGTLDYPPKGAPRS